MASKRPIRRDRGSRSRQPVLFALEPPRTASDRGKGAVARVVTDLSLDREFDYWVPDHLIGSVRAGSRVVVPFGHSTRVGYVVGLKARSDFPDLKEIIGVEGEREQIPANLIRLADWIADYYCCPKEQAVRAMLPAVVRGGKMKQKRQHFACLVEDREHSGAEFDKLTVKQKAVVQTLMRLGSIPVTDLCAESGAGRSVVTRLETSGWVTVEDRVVGRDPFAGDTVLRSTPLALTTHQAAAMQRIVAALDRSDGEVILMHGVTGSGKTEVYLQAIQHCLDSGREAIVLVPEISLTPQTCDRFRARFGDDVSVLHSGLSDGERFDEWMRIHEQRTHIVVGARSALFAPFTKPGLIIVDEEHEGTYKQEEAPRYNARDVAVVRGKMEGATVVLGSATPSLESYRNAETGKYTLVELPERVDNCRMPVMEVVDMCAEAALQGRAQIFSRRLESLVNDRLSKGEQTIFFLNRRGYATQMMCTACGFVATCDDCSATYTYHRHSEMLCCHLCGAILQAPQACPECHDPEIRYTGLGTEKIEAAAHAAFPKATIGRMDSDTMTTKRSYRETLDAFRTGRIHILIGTQMIAKGLHFPNVTLVGVIFADLGLHLPDFRAGERTFQLLTQVAGRAGRGEVPGHVIVQSYTPYHSALERAVAHDFRGFYTEEMESRTALCFPPATHMVAIHLRGDSEPEVARTAEELSAELQPRLPRGVLLAGPMPAPVAKIRTLYRYHMLLRGGNTRALLRVLRETVVTRPTPKGVDLYVDVDPRSLM